MQDFGDSRVSVHVAKAIASPQATDGADKRFEAAEQRGCLRFRLGLPRY